MYVHVSMMHPDKRQKRTLATTTTEINDLTCFPFSSGTVGVLDGSGEEPLLMGALMVCEGDEEGKDEVCIGVKVSITPDWLEGHSCGQRAEGVGAILSELVCAVPVGVIMFVAVPKEVLRSVFT